jgi:hypothetical protein
MKMPLPSKVTAPDPEGARSRLGFEARGADQSRDRQKLWRNHYEPPINADERR